MNIMIFMTKKEIAIPPPARAGGLLATSVEFSDYQKPHIYVNDKNVHKLENLCKNLVRLNIEKQNEHKWLCVKNDEEIKLINEIEQKNIAAMQLKDVYCSKQGGEENHERTTV